MTCYGAEDEVNYPYASLRVQLKRGKLETW